MKNFALPAALLAAAAIAVPASAATTISITPNPNPCSGTNCSFSVDGLTTDTNFSGSQTFTLPSTGFLSAALTSIRISNETDIDFTSISITNPLGVVSTFTLADNEPVALGTLASLAVTPGTYTLTVAGVSGGNASFGGNLSFAAATTAVPELSTWALLIAGFGVTGFAMRRRNSGAHARRPQLKFI